MNLGFKAFRVARTWIARDEKRRIWEGQDSFRNAIIPDNETTRERKLWGIYERYISIDLGCFRSRCLFPMLQNADSAKENEDPYPGRMSLIEHCNGQSAFGNACNIVANAKNHFFLVATMLQAFLKAFWPSRSFRRNFLAGFIPTSNSRYEGLNEILMGFSAFG